MDVLGHLVWWTVGSPTVRAADADRLLGGLGITARPNPVLPIDAFRRLTGEHRSRYRLDEADVSLDLHAAKSQHTMLVRHIVRTVRRDGVTQRVQKVGDCAFYRPPRGQHHRARMRVTVFPEALPDRPQVEAFAAELRTEYDRALSHLDPQAWRRLLRAYLAEVGAVCLDGPYAVPAADDAERLVRLLDMLGGDSRGYTVPLVDDEPRRQLLAAAQAKEQADG